MKMQLRNLTGLMLLASRLCLAAEGYTAARPSEKAVGTGGTLELVNRDVLISNQGDSPADQLHFPWLYESSNGNWYLTYRKGRHGASDGDLVQTVESSDRGETWKPWEGLTAEPWLFQFFPTRLPDDSLIFYRCRMFDLKAVADGTTEGTSYMYRSTDDGDTWTKYSAPVTGMPGSLYTTGDGLKTLWGTGILMADGRLLMGIISRDAGSVAGVAQSTDNGRSFQYLASVCHAPITRREPGMALMQNGDLVSAIRTGTNTSNMVLTRSSDGGRTWGQQQTLAEP